MRTDQIDIPAGSTGAAFNLAVHRFGESGARPAVYIQAALHADEIPGMICATVLRRLLQEAEAEGAIVGEVVLVPVANPIGLAQDVLGNPLGRFDLADGGNFNRNFPSFGKALAESVGDALDQDEAMNVALVRAALARLVADHPATTAAEHLKKALVGLAAPCDLVLDLHCDAEASMHLYTHDASAETFAPLAARLGCTAMLIAENSGGDPFDEALSRPWAELAAARPDVPLPQSCHSTTVELRGQGDVAQELATSDAAAILGFLRDVGVLSGTPEPLPARLCEPTPLAASLPLIAPVAGILTYRRDVGHRVAEGDVLATITDPVSGTTTEIQSPCNGMFFARTALRYVKPRKRLGKVAGRAAIRTGDLLSP
jgi:predicted deacylase